jgi:cysteine desulfurase
MENFIYLDNNATTQIDPKVLEVMMPFLTNSYANASSNHQFGVQISDAVKLARKQVADLIKAEPFEIVFTSGATEAINLAFKGIVENSKKKKNHIITVTTEHSAVLDCAKYLEKKGCDVTFLSVNKDGLIDLNELKASMREDTVLVSVMFVNNETGVIQPIKEIAEIVHEYGAVFMTDGTQALGKIPFAVEELGIDLMAFSGHKIYAPKGVGGLYVKNRKGRKVNLEALIHGGGHEKGMRSGTLNVPGIVGLGKACEIAQSEMASNAKKVKELRDYLEGELLKVDGSYVNGSTEQRLYNVSNIRFDGIDSDAVITGLENISISNGSACTSTSIEPSHVLVAMGLSDQEAYASLRLSLGKFNTRKEVDETIKAIKQAVGNLRVMTNG